MAQHRAPRKHVGTWTVITVLLAAAVVGEGVGGVGLRPGTRASIAAW